MCGEEFEIRTESIDIKEEWQIDSNPVLTVEFDCLDQPNVKKENEINDETMGHFAPEDLNFVKCEPQEEFIDAEENMEEDPLELGMKCKPQEKYVLYVVNYFLYGSAF